MIQVRTRQILLFLLGVALVILTYFVYPQKKSLYTEKIDKFKGVAEVEEDTSVNTFENISYAGTDQKGNPFEIGSKFAKILKSDPNLTYMTDVTAYFFFENDRTIVITSDAALYNKLSNDMLFKENVKVVDQKDTLTCEFLDVSPSNDLITAYDNIEFHSQKGTTFADKAQINLVTKISRISMYDNSQVKMKVVKWMGQKNFEFLNLNLNLF